MDDIHKRADDEAWDKKVDRGISDLTNPSRRAREAKRSQRYMERPDDNQSS